jgi:uncharacterized protein (TIGR03437 family)
MRFAKQVISKYLSYSVRIAAILAGLNGHSALAQSSLFTVSGTFAVGSGSLGNQDSPALVVADFNHDGNADIVTANTKDGTLTLLLGDGAGNFTQAPQSPIAARNKAVAAIATGDFNGDGNPDLAVASILVTEILLGDGKGGFSQGAGMPSPFNIPGAFGAGGTLLAVGDFNRDGKLDLLTWSPFGYSSIWLGDGTGGFGRPENSPPGSDLSSIVAGDFNGDGKLDLAATNGMPYVYLGDGTGHFSGQYQLLGGPGYGFGSAIAAGDFSGSGKADILTFLTAGYAPWQTWTWLWTGSTSTFLPFNEVMSSPPLALPTFVVTADFNGDGNVDWAGVDPYSGTVLVALGNGTGAFTPAPGSPYLVGGAPFALGAADFNGDGKIDLAVDTGSNVVLLLNGVPPLTGPPPVVSEIVNSASYAAAPIPPESYATLFGKNLAASPGDPVVVVTVTDATGFSAPASLVYAAPGQANIYILQGTAFGKGTVQISNRFGSSAPFPISIGTIAPGLFTVNAAGTIPAAQVVVAGANNSQTFEPVANCTSGACVLAPIVLDPSGQTYLILYGTGIRGRSSLSGVSVTIGGLPATVLYAGPQGTFPGLDQVNVLLPQALAGAKQVNVQLKILTDTANSVHLLFQ